MSRNNFKPFIALLLTCALTAPALAFKWPWQKEKAADQLKQNQPNAKVAVPAANPDAAAEPAAAPAQNSGYGDWQKCVMPTNMYLPMGNSRETGELDPNCRPDTLYSWGPDLKLASFLACASSTGEGCDLAKRAKVAAQLWKETFPRAVFATINPLPTFGYGDLMFRIKLKPGTKFVFKIDPSGSAYDLCKNVPAEQAKDSVIVRNWHIGRLYGLDYVLCGPGPIHSWSVGTKQGYEELKKSYEWTRSHKDWITYVSSKEQRSYLYLNLDKMDFSEKHLKKNFKTMQKMIEKGESGVFYAPGTEKRMSDHFASAKKSYWTAQ